MLSPTDTELILEFSKPGPMYKTILSLLISATISKYSNIHILLAIAANICANLVMNV